MILVVGLSPAWQRTLVYDQFVVGKVNRARCVSETASGKGVNVAHVAQQVGARARLLTIAGGETGELLVNSLKSKELDADVIRVRAETRVCQTLIAREFPTTELVEETKPLSQSEVAKVMACFERELRKSRMVVLSGSVPPGCGEDFYAQLVREANRRGIPVLIDAQRQQLLEAVKEKPYLVKINRDELGAAVGLECERKGQLESAVRRLVKLGAQRVAVTHGSEAVCAFEDVSRKLVIVKPPRIEAQNPIGSGDAVLAGIACGLWRGQSFSEALRLGIACGSANAMTPEPGCVRPKDVRMLLRFLR